MLIIGISGQAGAGKSTLAQMLSDRGLGENLEVDAIGHELLDNARVKKALEAAFGSDIFDLSGQICRRSLGRKAFCNKEATERLNAIMHPAMIEAVRMRVDQASKNGQNAIIVNAALLFAMGLDCLCNRLVYVIADPEIRLRRLVDYRHWAEDSARERLFAQDPLPSTKEVIRVENNGSERDLAMAADMLVKRLNMTAPKEIT